jgi:hypothetical protein
LEISFENLSVHQINVVGVAVASDAAHITDFGVQIECIITNYLAKDKPTEVPLTLFHPTGSRFMNQTTSVKRGSSLFFSGTLSSIENKLYLELHNFSFLRGQQSSISSSSTNRMPWLNSLKSPLPSPNPSPIKSQHPHQSQQPQQPPTPTTDTSSIATPILQQPSTPSTKTRNNAKNIHKNLQLSKTPAKRTRSSFRVNKLQKLADISSNALATGDPANNSDNAD